MQLFQFIAFLLVNNSFVRSLNLHGQCPKYNNFNKELLDNTTYNVVGHVEFNPFHNFNIFLAPFNGCLQLRFPENNHQYHRLRVYVECQHDRVVKESFEMSVLPNGTAQFITLIESDSGKKVLQDPALEVQFFQSKSDYLIIWGCFHGKFDKMHENGAWFLQRNLLKSDSTFKQRAQISSLIKSFLDLQTYFNRYDIKAWKEQMFNFHFSRSFKNCSSVCAQQMFWYKERSIKLETLEKTHTSISWISGLFFGLILISLIASIISIFLNIFNGRQTRLSRKIKPKNGGEIIQKY